MPKFFGRRSKSGFVGPFGSFFGCFALLAAGFLLGAYDGIGKHTDTSIIIVSLAFTSHTPLTSRVSISPRVSPRFRAQSPKGPPRSHRMRARAPILHALDHRPNASRARRITRDVIPSHASTRARRPRHLARDASRDGPCARPSRVTLTHARLVPIPPPRASVDRAPSHRAPTDRSRDRRSFVRGRLVRRRASRRVTHHWSRGRGGERRTARGRPRGRGRDTGRDCVCVVMVRDGVPGVVDMWSRSCVRDGGGLVNVCVVRGV